VLAVIELNDQSLLMQAEEGQLLQEPGFAYLSSTGIETGEAARACAWREPQNSFNQYWCQLNQVPLPAKPRWARHNADIAFAQLRKLWQNAGQPQSHIILAPGSFSDAQVSLILGMVKALPAEPMAVVDSALSACLNQTRDTLFVDMHLHQTVLSLCRFAGNALSVVEQEIIPDLGMMVVHNRLTRHISNLLIKSSRYDPLHTSEGEQKMCDQLPAWLNRLSWERESTLSLTTQQGDLPFILRIEDVQQLLTQPMAKLRSVIGRHGSSHLVFSHASRLLPSLFEEWSAAEVTPQSAGIDHVLGNRGSLIDQLTGLQRVRSLRLETIRTGESAAPPKLATHVLFRGRALPLHSPLSISITDDDVQLANRMDTNAGLTLVLRNRTLEVVHQAPGFEFSVPENCHPGEPLLVGGHRMKLIEVLDG